MSQLHARFWTLLSAIIAAGALAAAPLTEAAAGPSFAGKKINVIIGATPGGGTDGTTRLLGRYLERYLPGKPRMIYRNMPAGNGVQATNYFATVAKRDGTAWMGGGNAYIDAQVLRQKVVTYDPRTFNFIGGVYRGGSIMVMKSAKFANLKDKSLPPAIVGSSDGSGTWEEMMCWGAEFLGWNFRFVVGYPGTSSMLLAMRRGEIDSFGTSNLNLLASAQSAGDAKGLVQIGLLDGDKVLPRSSFRDVPTMESLIAGKISGIARQAYDYWAYSNQIDKWYALPPETPADVVKVYRASYAEAVKDPEFIKFGKAQFSADFSTQTAETVTKLVESTSYPSPEITAYSLKLRVKYGLPGKPLTAEELDRLAKKLVKSKTVTSALKQIKRGGRILYFAVGSETHSVRVSGSRTKVSIGGKKTKRKNLKVGMTCKIAYPANGGEAQSVACR